MTHEAPHRRAASVALFLSTALVLALLVGVGVIVRPFVTPLLWAIVLVVATWPLYVRLRGLLPTRPRLAALILTSSLGFLLMGVAIPLPIEIAGELHELRHRIAAIRLDQIQSVVSRVPLIGETLSTSLSSVIVGDNGLIGFIATHQEQLLRVATLAAKGVVETVTIVFFALAGCFVLYIHGETLTRQVQRVAQKLGATRADEILAYVGATVRGAAYSVIATALAQGTLAGLGYAAAGAPVPLLLAILTMLASLVPFGAALVYLPVSAYLLLGADLPWYHGIGVLVWGVAVVSTIDNLLRSLLISQTTHVSPIIVFIGVLGGVFSFGLLGVFIGPALIGVAQTLWLDFAEDESHGLS